jgi:hypothetical protein
MVYTVSRDSELLAGKKYQIEQIGDGNESIGDGRNRVFGTALVRTLKSSGHEVILTTRKQENTEQGFTTWVISQPIPTG